MSRSIHLSVKTNILATSDFSLQAAAQWVLLWQAWQAWPAWKMCSLTSQTLISLIASLVLADLCPWQKFFKSNCRVLDKQLCFFFGPLQKSGPLRERVSGIFFFLFQVPDFIFLSWPGGSLGRCELLPRQGWRDQRRSFEGWTADISRSSWRLFWHSGTQAQHTGSSEYNQTITQFF